MRANWVALSLASAMLCLADDDPRVTDALYRISREASGLWQSAPRYIAKETVTQKALVQKKRKVRLGIGGAALGRPEPTFETREIQSFYGLGAFKGSPEALKELRHLYAVDGKPLQQETTARAAFATELTSIDSVKTSLRENFEERSLGGVATDFGQLLLLFTKPNLDKYGFSFGGETRIGVDDAYLIHFAQQAGKESLHISESNRKISEKLQGEIAVRQGDFLPLRIALTAVHTRDRNEIRDEAKLDYTVISGALLPAALTYRRFVNDEMVIENVHRYSDWQPAATR